jgi:hypothetical protein
MTPPRRGLLVVGDVVIPVYLDRPTSWIMSKKSPWPSDRIDREIRAADALEKARLLPPGPERNAALKLASRLRCTAESQGPVFAKRGRPRK